MPLILAVAPCVTEVSLSDDVPSIEEHFCRLDVQSADLPHARFNTF
jgi:hypothetical protein